MNSTLECVLASAFGNLGDLAKIRIDWSLTLALISEQEPQEIQIDARNELT